MCHKACFTGFFARLRQKVPDRGGGGGGVGKTASACPTFPWPAMAASDQSQIDRFVHMMQHTGMGVARRAAEHVRQRAEREAEEAASDEPNDDERVPVAAEEVLESIALDAAHYAPKPKVEPIPLRDGRSLAPARLSRKFFQKLRWGSERPKVARKLRCRGGTLLMCTRQKMVAFATKYDTHKRQGASVARRARSWRRRL